MNNSKPRNKDTRHIRLRQKLVIVAVAGFLTAIVGMVLDAAISNTVPGEKILWGVLATFFLAMAAFAYLASAKCPSCGEAYIGNTVPDSDGPEAQLFAAQCRYCGHPR